MTDNTSDTPNGIDTSLGEPSMEDILASIRRIIAEDDDTDQGHLDIKAEELDAPISSTVPKDAAIAAAIDVESADADDILILDDLVQEAESFDAGANIEDLEIPELETEDFNPVSSVMSDLEVKLAEDREDSSKPEVFDLGEIFETEDRARNERASVSANDDEDPLLDVLDFESGRKEILSAITEDMTAEIEKKRANEPEEEFVTLGVIDDSDTTDELSAGLDSEESDLDIVKSLMADLTDTSFLEDEELEENIASDADNDEMLSDIIDEVEADDVDVSVLDEIEGLMDASEDMTKPLNAVENEVEDEDAILSDILELTIEDEEAAGLEGLDLLVEDADLQEESVETEDATSRLLQIAAAAEADAENAISGTESNETSEQPQVAMDGDISPPVLEDNFIEEFMEPEGPSTEELLSELDLALAEVTQADNQEENIVPELVVDMEQEPESALDEAMTEDLFVEPEETEDMARTARKDGIINEVTEEATSDAFASLSKAVEEKAVYTESGPRVGDIVQDALRPMLKEWLDENLKGIVERAVAKEVKRISSGK